MRSAGRLAEGPNPGEGRRRARAEEEGLRPRSCLSVGILGAGGYPVSCRMCFSAASAAVC